MFTHAMSPFAWISNGLFIVRTRSGVPIFQPSVNFGSGGTSAGFPSFAPESIHATIVFRSLSLSRRRSEEHTSELQSRENLVCRLLLEKKKKTPPNPGQNQLNNRQKA